MLLSYMVLILELLLTVAGPWPEDDDGPEKQMAKYVGALMRQDLMVRRLLFVSYLFLTEIADLECTSSWTCCYEASWL